MKKKPQTLPAKAAARGANSRPQESSKGAGSAADDRFGVQTDWLPLMAENPPYGADELARLAAALLPESVKQGLATGDLWPELQDGYFPPIIELDNAIAAAAYILNRAYEHALLARSASVSGEAKRKEIVPFIEAAKQITREKRADRAEAKLAGFLVAAEGREEKARHFEAWRKNGIPRGDMFALMAQYAGWEYMTNKRHREKIQEIVLAQPGVTKSAGRLSKRRG